MSRFFANKDTLPLNGLISARTRTSSAGEAEGRGWAELMLVPKVTMINAVAIRSPNLIFVTASITDKYNEN